MSTDEYGYPVLVIAFFAVWAAVIVAFLIRGGLGVLMS